jgi:hypothetical protein
MAMTSYLKKSVTAAAAFATLATLAAPAEARRWRHHDNDGETALAIGAGILGLGIVAAIASSARRDRYYDRYDDRYYGDRYYDYDDRYDRDYYDRGYYDRGYDDRYGDEDRCYTRRVWDPYSRRTVRVRYCDQY